MEAWAALRTWRPVVMGRRGAVAANHPLATEAGAAIHHAREGFGATRTLARYARDQAAALAADPDAARTFLPGGEPPALGTTIRQPALARTLEALAAGGRDAFYEGETARALVRWV